MYIIIIQTHYNGVVYHHVNMTHIYISEIATLVSMSHVYQFDHILQIKNEL